MFMEDVSGILLASPLLMPVMQHAGVDPILNPKLVFVFMAYLPVVLLTTLLPALQLALPRLVLGGP